MSDILDRLRKRAHPNLSFFTAAVGNNLCNAAPAIVQPAQTGVFTVGGPDKDVQDAIAEIERLRGVISDGANSSLDAAIRLADMSVQEIKLMAGEMTAGELRAVRAVVKGIVARLSALREAAK